MASGIYKITNRVNGHFYVGLSLDIPRRFVEHKTSRNLQRPSVLARAMRKHGPENFDLAVIEECDPHALSDREMFWIAQLKPHYNMNEGGLGNRGHTVSEEARAKMAAAARAQWEKKTPEERAVFVLRNLCGHGPNYSPSLATRQKLREHNLGKTIPPEVREKMSRAQRITMRGNRNGNKAVLGWTTDGACEYYASVLTAARELGIHPSSISKVLSGERPGCASRHWTRLFNTI